MNSGFRLGLVIVHYGSVELTIQCLQSIAKEYGKIQVFLVDNSTQSQQTLSDALKGFRLDGLVVPMKKNLGFAGGVNAGVHEAMQRGCEGIAVLNNDALVRQPFEMPLAQALTQHRDSLLAGFIKSSADGLPAHNIGRMDPLSGRLRFDFCGPEGPRGDFDFVSGCFFAAHVQVWRAIGDMDESFFLYSEDFDFCLRAKRMGIPVRWVQGIEITHKVSASVKASRVPAEYLRMRNHILALRRNGRILPLCLFALLATLIITVRRHAPGVRRQLAWGLWHGIKGQAGPPPAFLGGNHLEGGRR